jgi:hypothetical protein
MGAQPDEVIGPYRILYQIGREGMAHVFAAVHESDGQKVALRLLLKETAEHWQIARRFVQDYNVLSGLRYRNIVKVVAWGRPAEGVAYLAMERLIGPSLGELLRRQRRPTEVTTALAIGQQLEDIALAELRFQQKRLDEVAKRFNDAQTYSQALADGDPTRKFYALILGEALRGLERLTPVRNDHKGAVKPRAERYKLADRVGKGGPDPMTTSGFSGSGTGEP